jgi:chromosome segregation ATPase
MIFPSGLKLKSDELYRFQYEDYYLAISELLNKSSKINISSICKHLGKHRSAIRKDRSTFFTLIEDIEIANLYQITMSPDTKLKEVQVSAKKARVEAKSYKEQYKHILAGYLELQNHIKELNENLQETKEEMDAFKKLNSELKVQLAETQSKVTRIRKK